MAKATVIHGQKKTEKRYTIVVNKAGASLLKTALFRLKKCPNSAASVIRAAQDAHGKFSGAGVYDGTFTSNEDVTFRTDACDPQISVASEDAVVSEEPDKVTLEMDPEEAEAIMSLAGQVLTGAPTSGVYAGLFDAGVKRGSFKVEHAGNNAIRLTRK